MVTTIQLQDETLLLLKKFKSQLDASSYDETIRKMAHIKNESLAGFLGKGLSRKQKDEFLTNIRDKHDRKFND